MEAGVDAHFTERSSVRRNSGQAQENQFVRARATLHSFFFVGAARFALGILKKVQRREVKIRNEFVEAVQCGVSAGVFTSIARTNSIFFFLRGFIAGWCGLFICPRNNRWQIAIFTIVRAIEGVVRALTHHKRLPAVPFAEELLLTGSAGLLTHAFVLHQESLPKSQAKAMREHTHGIPDYLWEHLPRMYEGLPIDIAKINEYRAMECLPLLPQHASSEYDSLQPQELLHPGKGISEVISQAFLVGFVSFLKLNVLASGVSVLIFGQKSLAESPYATFFKTFQHVLRSSICLAISEALAGPSMSFWRSMGVTYTNCGVLAKLKFFLGGLVSFSTLLIERPSRRTELTLFFFSNILETYFPWMRRWSFLQVLFPTSVGLLFHLNAHEPQSLRRSVQKMIHSMTG